MARHLAAVLPQSPALVPFSPFEGNLINRAFAVIGLGRRRIRDVIGRIAVLIVLTWIPVALLTVYGNVELDQLPGQDLFFDIAAYAQFFLGLPLFMIAEYVIALFPMAWFAKKTRCGSRG
jgi:hypothetical protein